MNDNTKLPEDFKKKWVDALRSGDYQQGTTALYTQENDSYCCWGVACVLLGMEKSEIQGYTKMPNTIDLAELNDGTGRAYKKMTFSEIADYIEANL